MGNLPKFARVSFSLALLGSLGSIYAAIARDPVPFIFCALLAVLNLYVALSNLAKKQTGSSAADSPEGGGELEDNTAEAFSRKKLDEINNKGGGKIKRVKAKIPAETAADFDDPILVDSLTCLELHKSGLNQREIAIEINENKLSSDGKKVSKEKVGMLLDVGKAYFSPQYRFLTDLYICSNAVTFRDLKLLSNIYKATKKDKSTPKKVEKLVGFLVENEALNRSSSAELKRLDYSLSIKELQRQLINK